MSDVTPTILPLPPGMPESDWQAWFETVRPELLSAGFEEEMGLVVDRLNRMLVFGIPDAAVGCCALLQPGTEPCLVTVYASPEPAGQAQEMPRALVDIPAAHVFNSVDDTVDVKGFTLYRASRVVAPAGEPESVVLRGAIATTRGIAGLQRDVCLCFVGGEIDHLATVFWPLGVFLAGELAEQLILVGEGR